MAIFILSTNTVDGRGSYVDQEYYHHIQYSKRSRKGVLLFRLGRPTH